MRRDNKIALIAITVVLAVFGIAYVARRSNRPPTTIVNENQMQQNTPLTQVEQQEETEAFFDKNEFSTTDPASLWVVTNKNRALPEDFVPEIDIPNIRLRLDRSAEQMQLSAVAIPAIETMFADAAADGVNLVFGSGYRSYALQKQFYDGYVAQFGQAEADTFSARPGTSEHQTGLAFDVTAADGSCHLEICFEDTPEGKWVAENAQTYGFVIRYLEGKEDTTTYQYEPWHLRYVGPKLAAELKNNGQTLEEFFNISE